MDIFKTTVFATVLLAFSHTASADIRLKGGRVLISTGDHISQLLKHQQSSAKYSGRVCKAPSNHACKNRGYARGTIYEFTVPNRTYIVQTFRGTITYVEWEY